MQLQNLVVIMQRSAAGDDVNDLVTDLRTVVSAFAPLIYEPMDKDATNDELAERCRQLWEALKNTPKMDELLVSRSYVINTTMAYFCTSEMTLSQTKDSADIVLRAESQCRGGSGGWGGFRALQPPPPPPPPPPNHPEQSHPTVSKAYYSLA